MVLTSSTMLPLGTAAPDFALPDVVSGREISLGTFADKPALVVMFICRHCPYVEHIQDELKRISDDYAGGQVGIVGVSSNDAGSHPADGPDSLKQYAESLGLKFPVCFDESQAVAKAYTAACTPDFFLFDQHRQLTYRGQLDASRPGNSEPLDGRDLRQAIEDTLSGQPVAGTQKPSAGCNIKWKPGNEPSYFPR